MRLHNYDASADTEDVQNNRIKCACEFNALIYFHATSNYVHDLMLDMLEGVCKYDMVLLYAYLASNKYITLDLLNKRLQSLNYGYHDIGNKLQIITSLDGDMLPFYANEL